MQYSLVGTEEGSNITVFIPGKAPLVAHSTHPNFQKIVDGVNAQDESVVDLFDIAQTAASKFDRLTERVTVANGRLYLDGEEVHNAIAAQVLRFLNEGVEDWKPLVNFFENVQQNPQEHSREQLYTWLDNRDFTITPDGLIVGYKGVTTDLKSISHGTATVDGVVHTGAIPNAIGSIVEMPRGDVTFDPNSGCNVGLHVGTYRYAEGFARGALLEVHVNPRDVVSVPVDCEAEKMRVCRYRIVNTIDAPHTVSVVDDYYDESCDECGESDCDGTCPDFSDGDSLTEDAAINLIDSFIDSVSPGDIFQDLDKRRVGRTVTVEAIDGDVVTVKSLPSNVTVKVNKDRLLDPVRFRKV